MLFLKRLSPVVLLMLGCAVSASAGPITWTLQSVTFSGGGTAFGSFTYNADTNTYSVISITTTAGGLFTGTGYTNLNPNVSSSASVLDMLDAAGDTANGSPWLSFAFNNPLTDAGGTINLSTTSGGESFCTSGNCTGTSGAARFFAGGDVTASGTPEPSTWLLMVAGLAAMPWAKRWAARLHGR